MKLKSNKFILGGGSSSAPAGGAYNTLQPPSLLGTHSPPQSMPGCLVVDAWIFGPSSIDDKSMPLV